MQTLLCALPPLLFGAGLAGLLLPWVLRCDEKLERLQTNLSQHAPILWLSEDCETALGARSRPGRLRQSTLRCITSIIHTHVPQAGWPTEDQMATWPRQAELICRGNYAELHRYQDGLMGANRPKEANERRRSMIPSNARLLAWLSLALIGIGIVLLGLEIKYGWCAAPEPPIVPCPMCPKKEVTVATTELNTTLYFDYNKSVPYTPEHGKALDKALSEMFKDKTHIVVSSIVAHTDPIAGDAFNRQLATGRRAYVQKALIKLSQTAEMKGRFVQAQAISQATDDSARAAEHDSGYWTACFAKFYTAVDPAFRPLRNLESEMAGSRPACSQHSGKTFREAASSYPACRPMWSTEVRRMGPLVVYQRLDNFRLLTACLSPMRHVLITFASSAGP